MRPTPRERAERFIDRFLFGLRAFERDSWRRALRRAFGEADNAALDDAAALAKGTGADPPEVEELRSDLAADIERLRWEAEPRREPAPTLAPPPREKKKRKRRISAFRET